MARLLLVLVLSFAAAEAATGKKKSSGGAEAASDSAKKVPIVTAGLLYSTAELFYDVPSAIYAKFLASHVDTHRSTVEAKFGEATDALFEKTGQNKQVFFNKLVEVKDMANDMKTNLKALFAKAYDPASSFAITAIGHFEKAMPAYVGVIPHTLEDFVVFICYISVVSFLALKVAYGAFKIWLKLFCYFCCCGCCRRRESTTNGKHTNGNGKKTTPAPAKNAPAAGGKKGKKA